MKIFNSILVFCCVSSVLNAQIGHTDIHYLAISPDGKKVAYSGGKDRMAFKIIDYDNNKKVLAEMPRMSAKKLRFLNNQELQLGYESAYNWATKDYRMVQKDAKIHLEKSKIKIQRGGGTVQLQTETGIPFANFYCYDDSARYISYMEKVYGRSYRNVHNTINYLEASGEDSEIKEVLWTDPKQLACDHPQLGNSLAVDPQEEYMYINTSLGHSTLVKLSDLSTQDFKIDFQTQDQIVDDCHFSKDGKQLFVLNYCQLAIVDVKNPNKVRYSDTLDVLDGVSKLVVENDKVFGMGMDRVVCWNYKGDLESSFKVEGTLMFIHPKGYIVSYDDETNSIYFYSPKGNIVRKHSNAFYPKYFLKYETDPFMGNIRSLVLSEDGSRMICLEANNPQNYTIINLENLK